MSNLNEPDDYPASPASRYFFHVRNGNGLTRDDEGQSLHAGQTPRQIAIEGARSVIAADVLRGELDLNGSVEVTDADGRSVLLLYFRDALTII